MDTVGELLSCDWREIGIRLAGYTAFRARNLVWRTGSTEALAKGLMPGDIAAQAILSVISGERTWDPDRGPLLPFLKRVVDSLLNHLAESNDNRRVERLSLEDADILPQEVTEYRRLSNDPPMIPRTSPINAEVQSEPDDAADQKLQQLFAAAEGKRELVEVLNAIIEFDEMRPRQVAIRIGKPVSHVNNCLKRLRRLALKISATTGTTGPGAVSSGAPI